MAFFSVVLITIATGRVPIMAWLSQNWFWVLIAVAFVGMHLFGHGGHGGHGGCGGGSKADGDRKASNERQEDDSKSHRP